MRQVSIALAAILLLAGCAAQGYQQPRESSGEATRPSRLDYQQTRPDATPFDQAQATCWKQGFGAPSGSMSGHRADYEKCMNKMGWNNPAF